MHVVHTEAADFETATDAVKNMGIGWNLGNTLDGTTGYYRNYRTNGR